jgi:hypothetical protein
MMMSLYMDFLAKILLSFEQLLWMIKPSVIMKLFDSGLNRTARQSNVNHPTLEGDAIYSLPSVF